MSTLQFELITTTMTWDVPANVSCVRIERMVGGGGAGADGDINNAFGGLPGGGGGCGEYMTGLPIPVTPGGTLDIVIGSGGENNNPLGGQGGATTCLQYSCAGGWGGVSANGNPNDGHRGSGASAGGNGGGANGIGGSDRTGQLGLADGKHYFAGSSGGGGGVSDGTSGSDGAVCEGYSGGTGGGHTVGNGTGGGGGGASCFGAGGNGGDYNTDGSVAGGYGAGGGGGGGWFNSGTPRRIGGDGGGGAVILSWVA